MGNVMLRRKLHVIRLNKAKVKGKDECTFGKVFGGVSVVVKWALVINKSSF
mgnify:CR=1 FL=1